jgi:hypothetical protein
VKKSVTPTDNVDSVSATHCAQLGGAFCGDEKLQTCTSPMELAASAQTLDAGQARPG